METLRMFALIVLIDIPIVTLFILYLTRSRGRMRKAIRKAEKLSQHKWYVKGKIFLQGGTGLEFVQQGNQENRAYVPFMFGHPDIRLVQSLEHLDIVEFETHENTLIAGWKTDLCSHLRIKKIGRFA